MPRGTGDREILIHLLIYSTKLAYLQLIPVLVYGNSSPKSHEQDYLNFEKYVNLFSEGATLLKMNPFLGIS